MIDLVAFVASFLPIYILGAIAVSTAGQQGPTRGLK